MWRQGCEELTADAWVDPLGEGLGDTRSERVFIEEPTRH